MKKPDIVKTLLREQIPLSQRGSIFVSSCVFHKEKTPSMVVWPNKQRFKCFGCGANGDVVDFIMKHHNMSFNEAKEYLLIEGNGPIKNKKEVDRDDIYKRYISWKIKYLTKLAEDSIILHKKLTNLKHDWEMILYSEHYNKLAIIEYHLDILTMDGEKEKLELFKYIRERGSYV